MSLDWRAPVQVPMEVLGNAIINIVAGGTQTTWNLLQK